MKPLSELNGESSLAL